VLWAYVLARAVASAAFVVSVTRLAESVGPFWSGLIVALPISAGPAYVMLALQHNDAFIAASTVGSLAANAVTILFILVIVRLAPRAPWPVTLATALLTWLLAALAVRQVAWTALTAGLLNVVVFAACLSLVRDIHPPSTARPAMGRRRWHDLPLRALMVGILVAGVVTASGLPLLAVTSVPSGVTPSYCRPPLEKAGTE